MSGHISDPVPLVKPWWQSKTLLGIVTLSLAFLAEALRTGITEEEIGNVVTLAAGLLGAVLAVVGRYTARRKLTVPGGKYNPRAEVRRPKSYRFPKTGGSARVVALALCAGGFACGAWLAQVAEPWMVDRFGSREPYPDVIATMPVIRTNAPGEDARPWAARVMGSLHAVPQVRQGTNGRPVVHGVTVEGGADF